MYSQDKLGSVQGIVDIYLVDKKTNEVVKHISKHNTMTESFVRWIAMGGLGMSSAYPRYAASSGTSVTDKTDKTTPTSSNYKNCKSILPSNVSFCSNDSTAVASNNYFNINVNPVSSMLGGYSRVSNEKNYQAIYSSCGGSDAIYGLFALSKPVTITNKTEIPPYLDQTLTSINNTEKINSNVKKDTQNEKRYRKQTPAVCFYGHNGVQNVQHISSPDNSRKSSTDSSDRFMVFDNVRSGWGVDENDGMPVLTTVYQRSDGYAEIRSVVLGGYINQRETGFDPSFDVRYSEKDPTDFDNVSITNGKLSQTDFTFTTGSSSYSNAYCSKVDFKNTDNSYYILCPYLRQLDYDETKDGFYFVYSETLMYYDFANRACCVGSDDFKENSYTKSIFTSKTKNIDAWSGGFNLCSGGNETSAKIAYLDSSGTIDVVDWESGSIINYTIDGNLGTLICHPVMVARRGAAGSSDDKLDVFCSYKNGGKINVYRHVIDVASLRNGTAGETTTHETLLLKDNNLQSAQSGYKVSNWIVADNVKTGDEVGLGDLIVYNGYLYFCNKKVSSFSGVNSSSEFKKIPLEPSYDCDLCYRLSEGKYKLGKYNGSGFTPLTRESGVYVTQDSYLSSCNKGEVVVCYYSYSSYFGIFYCIKAVTNNVYFNSTDYFKKADDFISSEEVTSTKPLKQHETVVIKDMCAYLYVGSDDYLDSFDSDNYDTSKWKKIGYVNFSITKYNSYTMNKFYNDDGVLQYYSCIDNSCGLVPVYDSSNADFSSMSFAYNNTSYNHFITLTFDKVTGGFNHYQCTFPVYKYDTIVGTKYYSASNASTNLSTDENNAKSDDNVISWKLETTAEGTLLYKYSNATNNTSDPWVTYPISLIQQYDNSYNSNYEIGSVVKTEDGIFLLNSKSNVTKPDCSSNGNVGDDKTWIKIGSFDTDNTDFPFAIGQTEISSDRNSICIGSYDEEKSTYYLPICAISNKYSLTDLKSIYNSTASDYSECSNEYYQPGLMLKVTNVDNDGKTITDPTNNEYLKLDHVGDFTFGTYGERRAMVNTMDGLVPIILNRPQHWTCHLGSVLSGMNVPYDPELRDSVLVKGSDQILIIKYSYKFNVM